MALIELVGDYDPSEAKVKAPKQEAAPAAPEAEEPAAEEAAAEAAPEADEASAEEAAAEETTADAPAEE